MSDNLTLFDLILWAINLPLPDLTLWATNWPYLTSLEINSPELTLYATAWPYLILPCLVSDYFTLLGLNLMMDKLTLPDPSYERSPDFAWL